MDGQRVTNSTGFSGEGTDLRMDGAALSGSYRVVALGSPADLEQAVTLPGGFAATMSTFPGVSLEVTEEDELSVPASDYDGFTHGEPTAQ